jgi:hypothetical protein
VQCKVTFNDLVGGSVSFQDDGDTYNITMKKESAKTLLHGQGWMSGCGSLNRRISMDER